MGMHFHYDTLFDFCDKPPSSDVRFYNTFGSVTDGTSDKPAI